MKQLITLSICIISVFTAKSQSNEIEPNFHVGVNFGVSSLKLPSSNLNFRLTDESPSRDQINTNFDLPEKQILFTIKPYIDYTTSNGWQFEGSLEGGVGNGTSLYGLNIGILKNLVNKPDNRFFNKIGFQLGSGTCELYLGNIYQNDLYIQINGFKYFDRYVNVSYKESQLVFSPIYQFETYLSERALLRFNLGYKIPFGVSSNKIVFSGDKEWDGNPHVEQVDLTYRDMDLTLNNKSFTQNILNQRGIFMDLGVAFTF